MVKWDVSTESIHEELHPPVLNPHRKTPNRKARNKVLAVLDDFPITEKNSEMSTVEFYIESLGSISLERDAEGFGLLRWSLGKAYLNLVAQDKLRALQPHLRSIRGNIDKSMKYLTEACKVFTASDYPVMFAIISTMLLQLVVEKIHLEAEYSIVCFSDSRARKRAILQGLDIGEEAFSLLKYYKKDIEAAICCTYIAALYVLSSFDFLDLPASSSFSETSISYIQRSIHLLKANPPVDVYSNYLPILMQNKQVAFFKGFSYYLLALAHISFCPSDQRLAYTYLLKCITPKYFACDDYYSSLSRHKLGLLICFAPSVLEPPSDSVSGATPSAMKEFETLSQALHTSNMHLEAALQHPSANKTDIHLDLARNYITLVRMSARHGLLLMELTKSAKFHLNEADKCSIATGTPKDAYRSYYYSVAMSEMNIIAWNTRSEGTHTRLGETIEGARNALAAQPLGTNVDLHILALSQLSSFLLDPYLAPEPSISSISLGVRLLQSYSLLINRNFYCGGQYSEGSLSAYCGANHSTSLLVSAICRRMGWVKKDPRDSSAPLSASYRAASLSWSSESPLALLNPANALLMPSQNRANGDHILKTKPSFKQPSLIRQIIAEDKRNSADDSAMASGLARLKGVPFAPSQIKAPPPPKVAVTFLSISNAPRYLYFKQGIKPPMGPPPSQSLADSAPTFQPSIIKVEEELSESHLLHGNTFPTTVLCNTRPAILLTMGTVSNIIMTASSKSVSLAKRMIEFMTAFKTSFGNRSSSSSANSAQFDATESSIFTLSTLTTLSRCELIYTSGCLGLLRGAKMQALVAQCPDKEAIKKWVQYAKDIEAIIPQSLPLVTNIASLDRISSAGIHSLYRSQAKLLRLLNALEAHLTAKFRRSQPFFTMTTFAPFASRSLLGGEVDQIIATAAGLKNVTDQKRKEVAPSQGEPFTVNSGVDVVDSTGTGLREYFMKNFAWNECQLIWHVPTVKVEGQQEPLTLVLIWRKTEKVGVRSDRNIIVRTFRSDVDALQIRYLTQNLLSSLALPTRRRWSASSDALRQISSSLALGEILSLLPVQIDSLIICCPVLLRTIPWHLLHVDMVIKTKSWSSQVPVYKPEVVEIQVLDKFTVRMGPSISLYELSVLSSSSLVHSKGTYRMTCIDGGYDSSASLLEEDGPSHYQLEIACASSLWSAHVGDARVLSGASVKAALISTVGVSHQNPSKPTLSYFSNSQYAPAINDTERDEQLSNGISLHSCRVLHIIAAKSLTLPSAIQLSSSELTAKDIIGTVHFAS